MTELRPDQFSTFFEEIHGYEPFPWQERLATIVFEDGWPENIQMPTGAGKTAAIDIAVYHLALEATDENRSAPIRIFYTIDRRVVVDQTYRHTQEIVDGLQAALSGPREPSDSVTRRVAERLTELGDSPLTVERLRGGLFSDDIWFDTPAQPAVYPTTVDQIGSRLLFRGYGVSDSMKPVHAGLAGTDAIYILDEVHLSQPFKQTLERIDRLRTNENIDLPFETVSMSATPIEEGWSSPATRSQDLEHPVLGPRLKSRKETEIVKTDEMIHVDELVSRASDLVAFDESPSRRLIGVTVNTVRTARQVYDALETMSVNEWDGKPEVSLVVGRARGHEKQQTVEAVEEIASERSRADNDDRERQPHFVVATQTIEVGADFDFDGLVTELAPIDALRQRLGRVDRFGHLGSAPVVVVAQEEWVSPTAGSDVRCLECGEMYSSLAQHLQAHDLTKADYKEKYWPGAYEKTPEHPVYGRSLKPTLDWLEEQVSETDKVDLGANDDALPECGTARREAMCAPKQSAPTLLTPQVELLCQTSPVPSDQIDPDISLYLHGPDTSPKDVQVVWRADLFPDHDLPIVGPQMTGDSPVEERMIEAVAMRPPLPLEAVDLPVWAVQRWLSDGGDRTSSTDIPDTEGSGAREGLDRESTGRPVLIWRGHDEAHLARPSEISPGDTLIIPAQYGGHDAFAFDPSLTDTPVTDVSFQAMSTTDGVAPSLSMTPAVIDQLSGRLPEDIGDEVQKQLNQMTLDPKLPDAEDDIEAALESLSDSFAEVDSELGPQLTALRDRYEVLVHPVYSDEPEGNAYPILRRQPDNGRDSGSTRRRSQELLEPHSKAVSETVTGYLSTIPLADRVAEAPRRAAKYHDVGKLERRFQAWLQGGITNSGTPPLAKSALDPGSPESREAREIAGYPKGRRHEAISARLFEEMDSADDGPETDLTRYLIGSHHGHGRPLFPTPSAEQSPDTIVSPVFGEEIDIESNYDQYKHDSGWPDLFWRLIDTHGPWSLSYLEVIVRIADQHVSGGEV